MVRLFTGTLLLVFFLFTGFNAHSQTLHDNSCGGTSTSFTLDWGTESYTSGSNSQVISDIESSGYDATFTITGATGTLTTENGVSTPGITNSLSGGADALHFSSTGFDDEEIVQIDISFSPSVAGNIAFDVYNLIDGGAAGQNLTIYALTAGGNYIIPTFVDNGSPSWNLDGPGVIDGDASSTAGTNDQAGVEFSSFNEVTNVYIEFTRCNDCSNDLNTEFALGDMNFCLVPDTDQDGVVDPSDDDTDGDGIVDDTEKCPSNTVYTFDWSDYTWTGATTQTSNSFTMPDGTQMSCAAITNGASLQSIDINSDRVAGFGDTEETWEIIADQFNDDQSIDISMGFSQGIDSLSFTITDCDANPGDFFDSIIVVGYYSGFVVFPTLTGSGASVTVSGNTAVGLSAQDDVTGSAANVLVEFDTPIDSITVFYSNGVTAPAAPGDQAIGFYDFTYIGDCGVVDTDGDGVDDYLDIDADNDGIVDYIEWQASSATPVQPSGSDGDGDGIDDNFEANSDPVDTDGDGIPDFQDLDSDDDGELDNVEAYDGDNDGIADSLSLNSDADGDGLDDQYDIQSGFNDTTNVTNSGQTSHTFPDHDEAGTAERDWRESDWDGDGIQDYADLDDDNDGIPDTDEPQGSNNPAGDADGDGIPNFADTSDSGNPGDGSTTDYTDANGDGTPDVYDQDEDGLPNQCDIDADNDGIVDLRESGLDNATIASLDADNDGIIDGSNTFGFNGLVNDLETAADNGILNYSISDTDGDGSLPDFLDLDSDADGIIDYIEAQATTGSPLAPGGTDSDVDGLDNNFEAGGLSPVDTDGDGTPDYRDLDSDNDFSSDLIEGWDTTNDGVANTIPSGTDTDGDGIDDNFDDVSGINNTTNVTNNGEDALDFPNLEGAGTTERDWREAIDTDDDGVLDVFDEDSDNDGLSNITEGCINSAALGDTLDWNTTTWNGAPQTISLNNVDVSIASQFTGTAGTLTNAATEQGGFGGETSLMTTINAGSSNDSNEIFFSLSEDIDTVEFTLIDVDLRTGSGSQEVIRVEGYLNGTIVYPIMVGGTAVSVSGNVATGIANSSTPATTGNVTVTFNSAIDSMRVSQTYGPSSFGDPGNTRWSIHDIRLIQSGSVTCSLDTDGDGILDYLDLDSDDDGILDLYEGGLPTAATDTLDADGNGVIDVGQDFGTNGMANAAEGVANSGVEGYTIANTDGNGPSDFLDLDSDNDGILDAAENGNGTDAGDNGIIDGTTDDDDDGILSSADSDDSVFGSPSTTPSDLDGDGIPNFRDLDSDNDGILDLVENGNGTDANNDGVIDGTTDSDGDGILDSGDSEDGVRGSAGTSPLDTDLDGADDFLDIDADNDGITDNTEAQTTAGYVAPSGVDTDGDGVDDAYDTDCAPCGGVTGVFVDPTNTDSDSSPDYVDLDSDNDGYLDLIEGHDSDQDQTADSGSPANTGVGGSADADGDGLLDGWDNNTSSTDPTNGSLNPSSHPDNNEPATAERDWRELNDNDNDGIADIDDIDDDNDGIPDVDECSALSLVSGGFDDLGVVDLGNNIGDPIAPWITSQQTNVVVVDGPGGFNYGGGGPAHDANGGAGAYYDVASAAGDIYQTFTLSTLSTIIFDGYFSARDGATGTGYVTIRSGTGLGGAVMASSDTVTNNDNVNWAYVSGVVQLEAGTYSYVATLSNPSNFDEGAISTFCDDDGDGVPNQFDLDSDNDGIPDIVEAGGADEDGDGLVDSFVDANSNGLDDTYDGSSGGTAIANGDTDGDGVNDFLDLDADNDGIPDVVEAGGTDEDGDGRADNFVDTDNDGFNDDLDGDVGNDGTAENTAQALQITGADNDNDGVPDSFPSDDDDGDDIPNQLDLDADNDGIPDVVEAGGTDEDGDGRFDDAATDTDGDGFADDVDGDVGNDGTAENTGDALSITGADNDNDGAPNSFPSDDTDGDNVLDYLDLDADNDGIPDVVEAGGTDTDGDGRFDDAATDTDNDGFADDVDGDVGNDGTAENTDNALQVTGADNDNDGAPNSFPSDDIDGDNIPNQLDIDSDNDGIVDVLEAGGVDADEDGRVDGNTTDTDGDGYADGVDGDVGNDGTAENSGNSITVTGTDTDDDGAPNSFPNDDADGDDLYNFIDIDADNDGIVDNSEGQTTSGYAAPSGSDTDGDGLDDAYDPDCAPCGGVTGAYVDPTDSDSDGTDDYLDSDSDGDGIPDIVEGHDSDGDFVADSGSPADSGVSGGATDADGDGLLDGWDNNTSSVDPSNNSLTPTSHPDLTNTVTAEREWRETKDSDNDGIADILDLDDDNDGIADTTESNGNEPDGDEDGDGIINWLDTSDDGAGDGTVTDYTDSDGDGIPDVYDFDGDGIPNHLDKDSDNDGIVDIIEAGGTDINEDGEVDYPTPGDPTSMTDVDNDGLDDNRDDQDSGSGGGEVTSGTPWTLPNSGSDSNPDYLDIDADDDGIVDNTEAQSTVAYAAPSGVDTDRDGIDDAYDPDCAPCGAVTGVYIDPENTDGTGNPDYTDTDSDDDGESDAIEGHDSDGNGTADSGSPADSGVSGGSTDADGDGLLDGYDNNTASLDPTNGSLTPSSHPNEDEGDSERDWREAPCAGGSITLASDNATTTASDYCTEGDYTYYYDPAEPTELLFAIEHTPAGGNTSDFTVSVDITVSSAPTTSGGVFSAENAGAGEATFVMGRYYNINITSGSLNGNVNVRFYYDTDESSALATTADDWNTANAGGTSNVSGLRWFAMNSGTFDPGSADLQSTGIQGSSEVIPTATTTEDGVDFVQFSLGSLTGGGLGYTVGTNSVVLPVEWFSFDAQKEENYVHLHWITATEKNTDAFKIERSTPENPEWHQIGQVKAAGQSQVLTSYDSYDRDPATGLNYYRIKQVDLDQSFDYSETRSVLFTSSEGTSVMVFPNPNDGSFTVQLGNPSIVEQVVLLSAKGELIQIWDNAAFGDGRIEVSGLSSGPYLLQVVTAEELQSLRVIVN